MKDYALGNLITKLRTAKGYSQYQLGRLVGVSDKAVSKWENGCAVPKIKTCIRLAEVLDVDVKALITAETAMAKQHDFQDIWEEIKLELSKRMPAEDYQRYIEGVLSIDELDGDLLVLYYEGDLMEQAIAGTLLLIEECASRVLDKEIHIALTKIHLQDAENM